MDEAAAVREGAREVLRDVSPPELRRQVHATLEDGWSVPGVVTLVAARRAGVEELDAGLRSRAIGVQLVYEGLALTRRLVREEPWSPGDPGVDDRVADVDVLVADVLVSRGSRLLSATEAADRCVEVIRSFGRRQTRSEVGAADRALEAEVLALAAVAGTTTVTPPPAPHAVEWAEALSDSLDGGDLPDAGTLVAGVDSTTRAGQPAVANEGPSPGTDP